MNRLDQLCPAAVRRLMRVFADAGEAAYLVGGCVRDALMGRTPHDWDMAVTTPPEETRRLCEAVGYRTIPTGMTHGTVTVLLPGATPGTPGEPVECTTCRTEGGYSDGRHPDSVAFTGRIRDDLSRRDFTVNAMAATPAGDGTFEIIDLYGGREDLAAGVLRCVGDPTVRLTEDALRILRAVRFSVKLGFTPDPALAAAIPAVAPGLTRVSRERVAAEFLQILCHPNASCGLELLTTWGLWPYVLPQGKSIPATGLFPTINALPPTPETRLAWLLWENSPDEARADLQSLRLPTEIVRRAMLYLSEREIPLPQATPEQARRLRNRLGKETLASLSVRASRGQDTDALAALVCASEARGDCVTLKDLAVSGRDLAARGIPAGRETGRWLAALLDAVLTAPEKNERETLLAMIMPHPRGAE